MQIEDGNALPAKEWPYGLTLTLGTRALYSRGFGRIFLMVSHGTYETRKLIIMFLLGRPPRG